MTTPDAFTRFLAATLLIATITGCGGAPMAQVSGKVLYTDGEPIEGGIRVINFQAKKASDAKERRTASSPIASDGSFSLSTRRKGDGVFKGQYHVTITAVADSVTGRPIIPEKYNYTGETPFEADITTNRDDLLYEIERLE